MIVRLKPGSRPTRDRIWLTSRPVVELTPKGHMVRLACEASFDGKVALDGEAVVSVPGRRKTVSA